MKRQRDGKRTARLAGLALLLAAMGAGAQEAAPDVAPVEVGSGDGAPIVVEDADWGRGEGIRMNFMDAPLDTVLEYLSKEAGFTIVREVPVEGRVDIESHHPLNRDEVVELLNTVLNTRGYAAVRSGRTLTIVRREDAVQRNIPVRMGADPEQIPATDEMVTHIIPVRYADATKLVDNLQALMAPHAVISPNESSNAIVLTDTQANIRRMVEIVKALDTSISSISAIKVFVLDFADAKETAQLVTSVFEMPTQDQNQGMPSFRGRGGGFPFGPGGPQEEDSGGDSPARKAVSRVVAVAETRTNAVVVSAPDDIMPTITDLVEEIDTASNTDTEIRVFPLQHASAEDMAALITSVFSADASSDRAQTGPRFAGPGAFFGRAFGRGGNQQTTTPTGGTQSLVGDVTAVADTRTNAVVVSAPAQLLMQIEGMVIELDQNPARTKKVFVYSLKNADAETVAAIVEGMFTQQSGTRTNTNTTAGQRRTTGTGTTTRNTGRTNTGATGRSSQGLGGR